MAAAKATRKNTSRSRAEVKSARLEVRLNVASKEIIERAASASHQSLTDFTVTTLLRSASEVLERQKVIRLSDRDRDRFLAALEGARPNEALRKAAERYKKEHA